MLKTQSQVTYGFDNEASQGLFAPAVDLLKHGLSSHFKMKAVESRDPSLIFKMDQTQPRDAYSIVSSATGISQINASTTQGANAAIGVWLRRGTLGNGVFRPSDFDLTSSPKCAIRGMYFATHYNNYLHVAPEQEINSYLKDLALWGCNYFAAWFDMHHYSDIGDPAAVNMVHRLRSNFQAAKAASMKTALVIVANEAFDSTPDSIRAEWNVQNGYHHSPQAHYHVEVCPNKPGGMDYIIEQKKQVLEAMRDIDFDQIILWPYDQGGCTCKECAPWGAKTFPLLAEKLSALIREFYPKVEIVLSTWSYDRFIEGEWQALDAYFKESPPDWADYLMADAMGNDFPEYPLKNGVPGNLPLLNFPEISMEGLVPWGGFGASPMPRRLERFWSQSGNQLAGGFPYSEGIFEDINKVIMLGLYWGNSVRETVLEYATWEFGAKYAQDITALIYDLDQQTDHGYWEIDPGDAQTLAQIFPVDEEPSKTSFYCAGKLQDAIEIFDRADEINNQLHPDIKQTWRWRMIYLRAAIDHEIKKSDGHFTKKLDSFIEQVISISYADTADFPLRPLNRRTLVEMWKDPSFRPEDWKVLWTKKTI